MAKRKSKPLGGKYKFRRFLLTFFLLALAGAGGWFAYGNTDLLMSVFAPQAPAAVSEAESESMAEPASESEPEADSASEREAEPESESEPESKPEPEPAAPDEDWALLLVNKGNPIAADYSPELETIVDSYRVDKRIADKVRLMFADAKESGINLLICSAYRSQEKQTENFNNKKQEYINAGKTADEAVAVTATIIAEPGTSEHHTGLALDIVTPSYQSLDSGFANTPAFKWLSENAAKYGFILRYPADKQAVTGIIYEPWHYRYVGERNAALINSSGLCLEEYVYALKNPVTNTEESEPEDAETDGASEQEVSG